MYASVKNKQGFSLVEVIIVSALSAAIFGALLGSFFYTLRVVNLSEAKLSAQSLANDRMEFFRSLPYDDVGTIAGIPSGTIPQNSTTSLNGIEFAERVLVEYVDDNADGFGPADSNGILSDYKRLKLEYTWEIRGQVGSIALISNIVPRSIETTAGGGSVRINVIDSESNLLPGAEVRLFNTTGVPIDVSRFTDATGAALFSGAPAASNYEVVVTADISGSQYSSARTYQATTTNPTPAVAPFSVLEADISTLTFQIGELSDLSITTLSDIAEGSLIEPFTDLSAVASSSDVAAFGGDLQLENTLGVYASNGVAYLGPIAPSPLLSWESLTVSGDNALFGSYRVQLFTSLAPMGPFTLIPDGDMPGNSIGFSDILTDISDLDAGTYPSIYVGVSLETTDTSSTPEVNEVAVYYRQDQTVLPSVDLSVTGNKVIGTSTSSSPIYKVSTTTTADSSGEIDLTDVEFDTYTFAVAGYDIATACGGYPFLQRAGFDGESALVLVGDQADTLRVEVLDTSGRYIPGVTVNLNRAGYDVSIDTNTCGQAFFSGGVGSFNDYQLVVSAIGYTSEVVDPLEIIDDVKLVVVLSE